jgi:T5SS/PEP-CTERM-associated repeat protein
MEIIMAVFQWTGSANTGDFSTAKNWQPAAGAPPGPNDMAKIEGATVPITGTGNPEILYTTGTVELAGHFTETYGSPVNAQQLTLLPGAVLTTPMLHFVVGIDSPPPMIGNMTVGAGSAVVIAGSHTPDDYAIEMSELSGSTASLAVEGAGAVVNGGNLPMSVGQAGPSSLTIRNGGVVSVGNADPLIYPWCLVIGNHAGSSGTVQVQRASLLGHGEIIVGRNSTGTLNVDEGGLVVAEDLAIGWEPENQQVSPPTKGIGTVTVKGRGARLIVDNQLEVQHMGTGSLTVADHGFVSAGVGIIVNGTLSLANGVINTLALGVNSGGALSGNGTVVAAQGIVNNGGVITADGKLILVGDIDNAPTNHGSSMTVAAGSELQCFGALTDDGTLSLQDHSVASLEAVASGQTVSFDGLQARLVLRSPGGFHGSISGFGQTHKIVLEAEVTNVAFAANGVLTVTGPGGVVAQLQMIGPYDPPNFLLAPGFPGVITV